MPGNPVRSDHRNHENAPVKKPIPFGKYYLLERINVGGMAEVFRAKAYGVEGFERLIAVKRILPNIAADQAFIEMFVDEAKIAVQLNHANVAQIFDLGRADGSYYIALEHVHGRDVRAIFDRCAARKERMPVAQAAYITMKMCEGLDYAHNKRDQAGRPLNLVHRDVSPQNVLVSFEGEVKVIDFGIAMAAGKGAQTRSGILKGKFGYMSPEQVRGLPIDRRSDIFSCGIVLYELLTGERLFVGASDFSTLEKVRNVEILPPSTYNRDIPEELERIVLKALARDLDERYQGANELHDDLQSFVYDARAFCSRKDLAAWMKGMFAREIEEESAKLERYRHVRPPPPPPPELRRSAAMAVVSLPIPGEGGRRASSQLPVMRPPSADPVGGSWSGLPAADASGPMHGDAAGSSQRMQRATSPGLYPGEADEHAGEGGGPAWQDATLIAPAPERMADSAARGSASDMAAGRGSATDMSMHPAVSIVGPDLDGTRPDGRVPVRRARSRKRLYLGGAAAALLLCGAGVAGYTLSAGADDRGEAVAEATARGAGGPEHADMLPADMLAPEVLAATGIDLFIEPRNATVKLDGKVQDMASPMRIRHLAPGAHELVVSGPRGFYSQTRTITVTAGTAELVQISLDPLSISGRFESTPPGASVSLVINGDTAHPIALGEAPAAHALDPRKRYEAVFEKDGYQRVTVPVTVSGTLEERVTAVLAPIAQVADASANTGADGDAERGTERSREKRRPRERRDPVAAVQESARAIARSESERSGGKQRSGEGTAQSDATGTLMLGSKPPCRILIDGKDTGKTTPQRNLTLPAGKHRITLVNREYGIQETFEVEIDAGKTARVLKDMSTRIK